jgi:hypothetical protein
MDHPHPNYAAAWRDYRKRRLIFWAATFGYVPGVVILIAGVGLPISAVTGIKLDYFVYSIAGGWLLAIVMASWREASFKCPRCGNRFFSTWWHRIGYVRQCVHCGLPRWAKAPPQSN